jgi:predicted regulator of Ras-like GTPase activity (Roadblock/LC7/MglB family)
MFLDKLSRISERVEGVRALALVDHDGISVESVSSDPDLDLELLAAELVTQARAMNDHNRELQIGEVQQFSITTERAILLMSAVEGGYFLLLVLEPGGNYGRARFELRRARLSLEDELLP